MGEGMSAAALAEMGFHSWKDKLSKLPDDTRFFPAHGAGSLCGAHLSDKPVSTIGEQRRENVYLQHKDLPSYVMAVIDGLPDAPQYFKHNAKMNHDGPPLVDWEKTTPPALPAADVAARAQKGRVARRRSRRQGVRRRPSAGRDQHRHSGPIRDVDRHHDPVGRALRPRRARTTRSARRPSA